MFRTALKIHLQSTSINLSWLRQRAKYFRLSLLYRDKTTVFDFSPCGFRRNNHRTGISQVKSNLIIILINHLCRSWYQYYLCRNLILKIIYFILYEDNVSVTDKILAITNRYIIDIIVVCKLNYNRQYHLQIEEYYLSVIKLWNASI